MAAPLRVPERDTRIQRGHQRLHAAQLYLQQATSLLIDVLKGNKEEEDPLQNRLLEMNLSRRWPAPSWPTTCSRSAMSRASAGLMQCTIEHYENLDDLKRVVSRTELI